MQLELPLGLPAITDTTYVQSVTHVTVPKKKNRRKLKATGVRCPYCRVPMVGPISRHNDQYPSWDHIIPKSRGGSNNLGNMLICCRRCNHDKRSHLLVEWAFMLHKKKDYRWVHVADLALTLSYPGRTKRKYKKSVEYQDLKARLMEIVQNETDSLQQQVHQ